MALTNVKGLHTTPGIYQKETEMKSTRETPSGITTLGLVGETLQGPAFTPMYIENWKQFTEVFGGTSTEQYSGSKYPRYELPYIAKDYLTESSQLYVTRVLGFSGYNAGKAWVIKAIGSGDGKDMLVAVIRSRGNFIKTYGLPKFSDNRIVGDTARGENNGKIEKNVQYVVGKMEQNSDEPIPANANIKYGNETYTFGQKFFGGDIPTYTSSGTSNKDLTVYAYCGTNYEYDKFIWDVKNVYITTAGQASANFTCGMSGKFENTDLLGVQCTPTDFGTFKLVCELDNGLYTSHVAFTVSLNSGSPDYIYNVLGGTPQGVTPIWVEELYDVALQTLVDKRNTDPVNYIEGILLGDVCNTFTINGEQTIVYDGLSEYGSEDSIISHFRAVNSVLTKPNADLLESNLNERYLYVWNESINADYIDNTFTDSNGKVLINEDGDVVIDDVGKRKVIGNISDDGKILTVKRDIDDNGRATYNYHFFGEQLDPNAKKNPFASSISGDNEKPNNEYYAYVFVSDQNLFYKITKISGGGTGASVATNGVIMGPGEVTEIIINETESKKYKFRNIPTVTISSPPSGLTNRTAIAGQVVLGGKNTPREGQILKINIKNGGSGYTTKPNVSVSGTLENGSALNNNNEIATADWGYPIKEIKIGNSGNNYETTPEVYINTGTPMVHCTSPAMAEAVIRGKKVVKIEILDPGRGYKSAPSVRIGPVAGSNQENDTYTSMVVGNVSDYKEAYRTPVTPWIVSQMMGTYKVNEVKKLFRFFTISDGSNANFLFKISIMNINPETLTFDVLVRDFADNDANPRILEMFKHCNLNPASSGYILNKIGDVNGSTVQKSSFVMVEVADNDTIKYCIPSGFLGVPVRYLDASVKKPQLPFNTNIFEGIKPKRQFFGFSDLVGIDVDSLSYKGRSAYSDGYYTDGFHLDSRVTNCNTMVDGVNTNVNCSGTNPELYTNGVFTWQTPSMNLGDYEEPPMLTSIGDVIGTVYEDINYRKFTVCFYGGFDGWDPYRTHRTTGDEYKKNKYKGRISTLSGSGDRFSVLLGDYGLTGGAITSDYYAFAAGFETMSNPFATPINVFATPGVDYVNDTLLVKDAIDVVERDYNQKTIYFVTTPDKPFGANDNISNMYSALDAVGNLDTAEIDSSYTATYFPWCQYLDTNENKTIFLPPTKDIIRLVTEIDNTSYSWYPSAGINNGQIDCIGPRKVLKMEETDILTGSRINPIVKFSRQGVYSWGQKNLKVSYDDDREALTRIGVRRMMIRIKEMVEHVNRGLLFTPNDMTTANRFKSNTAAILNDVRSNRGISDYRIEVDNSVEARENRTLPAKVWIKPNSMLEFIEIEWVITPQGMEMV